MRILLTGASGFIGRHIHAALETQGHEVVACVRDANYWRRRHPDSDYCIIDFSKMHTPADWSSLLSDVDIVINTVGIIAESKGNTFTALHEQVPKALFQACAECSVRRVIQVSALGADEAATSRYHLSKKAADDYLLTLNLEAIVLQPSLVFGVDGDSSQVFLTQASLPLIPLPGAGNNEVQPIHIDDMVAVVIKLLEAEKIDLQRLALVGPQPLSWRNYLAALRSGSGLTHSCFLPIPMPLMYAIARVAEYIPGETLLNRENLSMLERGNTASADSVHNWLGHPPRPVSEFIPPDQRLMIRQSALLRWLIPTLQLSLAIVWIVTGLVSIGLYPISSSYALLARVGIEGIGAPVMLYGAALLDITLGILTLIAGRRWLWWFQLFLISIYSVIVTVFLPEYWLHPFAPVLKNIPMLAVLILLINLKG